VTEWRGVGPEAEAFFEDWDLTGDSETDAVPDLVRLLRRAQAHAFVEGALYVGGSLDAIEAHVEAIERGEVEP
jgi:hypothetical protein